MSEIRFYLSSERPWGAFSNLYRSNIDVRGRRYRSVEDAYQSLKPRKAEVREWLLAAPSPRLLARVSHEALTDFDKSPHWPVLKYAWMFECLLAKYEQDSECRALLLSTGDARLIEAGSADNKANRQWGEVQGQGSNLLGRMLMLVRSRCGGVAYQDAEVEQMIESGKAALEERLTQIAAEDFHPK